MTTKDYPPKTTEEKEIERQIKEQKESQKAMIKALIGLVSDEKINEMCEAAGIKREDLEISQKEKEEENNLPENKEPEKINKDEELRNEYYDKALEIITRTGNTTFSNLMRKLKISVGKAKRLLEMLEQDGILGPSIKGSPREILKKDPTPEKNTAKEGYKTGDTIEFTSEGIKKIGEKEQETDAEKIIRLRAEAEAELEAKENADKGKESSRYNFLWQEVRGDSDLIYRHEQGTFTFEINGKETEVTVYENKTEWKKHSIFWKIRRLNFKREKEIFKEKPTWATYVTTENNELDQKYPEEYEFETKEKAMAFAEKIIDDGMKIKNEEEKTFMGIKEPEPTPEPASTTPETNLETEKEKPNLNQEELFNKLNNIEKSTEEKLNSSNFRDKIIKGLDSWEKFGQGEKGLEGFSKRMSKLAVNLALIGIISSFAVDQLAEAGIGSATALGGGVFSYSGRKMAIGLGFGMAFDRIGNKLSSDTNKKRAEIIKKIMPWAVGVGSVTAATLTTGGMVGVAAGVGFLASKFIKGRYTKEKIENRQEKAKEKLLTEIKAKGETIDPKDAELFEEKMAKIIKKYENQKIWGRLVDGAVKISLASTIAAITLEASGLTKDQLNHTDSNEIKNSDSGTEKESSSDSSTQENKPPEDSAINNRPEENSLQDTESDKNEIKPDTQDQNDVEIKEVSVDFNSKGAIQTIIDLKKELNTKYNEDFSKAPSSIQDFIETDSTKLAIKLGFYNPNDPSESAMILKGSTLGFNNDGDLIMHDVKSNQDYNLIQDEEIDIISKYQGKMFDSDNSGAKIETPVNPDQNGSIDTSITQENEGEYQSEGQINQRAGLPVEDNLNEKINPETGKSYENEEVPDKTISKETDSKFVNIERDLTPKELANVHKVFDDNIDHLLRERPRAEWESIKNHIPADRILELYEKGEVLENFKPLVRHMLDLKEITGLRPQGIDILHPEAETIPHYIGRALEEAQRIGKIDEVTL